MIRVIVNGAKGKMGLLACQTLNRDKDFDLVAELGKHDDLAQSIANTKAQVVLDLTRADCVYENSKIIIQSGARPVIGSSGLVDAQIQELNALCETRQLGGIIVPNFSIAATLMMLFASKAAEYLSEVEIIEAHHQQKLDSPSGTALKTAEMIAAARMNVKNKLELKEMIPGARGAVFHDINIHSLRLPGILARQEIIFGSLGETLSVVHNSIDRQCYMPGIVLACHKVLGLSSMVYGLEQIL